MSIKEKYQRNKQEPPKKKGNADIISKIVHNEETVNTAIQQTVDTEVHETVDTGMQKPVNTERNVKKATFELDADLHKRLRVFAMMNDTTMVDVVKTAIIEYLNKRDN